MKKIAIAGASGMIGGLILRKSLASDQISDIFSIVRKPSGMVHPKLKEIVLQDFLNYNEIKNQLPTADIAYFCIGVYSGKQSDIEFKKITVDYAKAFADAIYEKSPQCRFCLLSAEGADLKEKSIVPFAKFKGMAENYLLKKSFRESYIFRPAYIYPVEPRTEPHLGYSILRYFYPLLKLIFPARVISSEQLAEAMFITGLNGAHKTIFENQEIKEFLE